MKFSTVFVTIASLASMTAAAPATVSKRAETEAVKLWVESPGTEVDQQGLSAKHEGAGLSYVFLGTNTEEYQFNKTSKNLYFKVGQYDWPFSVENGVAQFSGAAEGTELSFADDYVAINGSTHIFAACKNLKNDPYGYSKNEWALTYTPDKIPSDCIALRLRKGH